MPTEDKKTVDIDTSGPGAEIDIEEQKDESVVETEAPKEKEAEAPSEEPVETKQEEEKQEPKKQDEQLEDYSKGVQARIAKLTRKMREAERQRDAATEYAKSVEEKRLAMEKRFEKTDADYIKKFETSINTGLEAAQKELAAAIEAGDAQAQVEANKRIATLAFENSSNTGVASIGTHSGASTLYYVCATHLFHIGGGYKLQMSGNSMQPYSGVTNFDLGASGARFNNIYTSDLDLSNEAKGGNDVDGTWGSYTIQEGESDLFLINKRNGKKYKFLLKEVD